MSSIRRYTKRILLLTTLLFAQQTHAMSISGSGSFTLCSGSLPVKNILCKYSSGESGLVTGRREYLTITAPATMQVSFDGVNWATTASFNFLISTTVVQNGYQKYAYVRPAPTTTSATTGSIAFVSSNTSDRTLSFTVTDGFSILTTSPKSRCASGTVTLEATSNGGTITWYDAPAAGNTLGTGATLATPVLSTTTTYYVATVSASCTNPTRIPVLATVVSVPSVATATAHHTRCGAGPVRLKASTSGGFNIYWKEGLGASPVTNAATGNEYLAQVIESTTFSVVAGNSNPGCISPEQTLAVTVVSRAEWTGSGTFDDSTHWSCGTTPGTGLVTVFASGVCQLDGDVSVALGDKWRIRSGATVAVPPGHTLSVAGTVSNHGSLELNASSTGYSQLFLESTGTYADSSTGTVTQERYLDETGWTGLSSPFAVPLSQFGAVGANSQANFYHWDPSTSNWVNNPTGTALAVPGRGYNAYVGSGGVAASGTILALSGIPLASASPVVAYHNGTGSNATFHNQGSNPNAASGWNLLGNPFLCNLDYTALNPTTSGLANAFYVWRNTLNGGSYRAHGPLATGIARDAVVEPLQAVWVQATSSNPSVPGNWTPQSKGSRMRRTFSKGQGVDKLVLELSAFNAPMRSDDLILGIVPDAFREFDPNWDARELMHSGDFPNLYLLTPNGDALTHKSVDLTVSDPEPLQLGVQTPLAGTPYRIHFNPDWCQTVEPIYLRDKLLRNLHPLHLSDYVFIGSSEAQEDRFELILTNAKTGALGYDEAELAALTAWVSGSELWITGLGFGVHEIDVVSIDGRIMSSAILRAEDGIPTVMALPEMPAGLYIIHSRANGLQRGVKFAMPQ